MIPSETIDEAAAAICRVLGLSFHVLSPADRETYRRCGEAALAVDYIDDPDDEWA